MTDRKDLDRPAAVTAFALGVILIVVSIPLLSIVEDAGDKTYTVSWNQVAAGAASAQQAPAGQTASVTVSVVDALASNATVTLVCNDNRGPGNVAAAAQVTWTLKSGGTTLLDGTSCNGATTALRGHPDVAQVGAGSSVQALKAAWAPAENITADYTLEFTWTRAPPPGGLPIPLQTSFTATLSVEVLEWAATVNEKGAEASR